MNPERLIGSFIDQSDPSAEPGILIEALRERTKVKIAKSANHKQQRLTKLHFYKKQKIQKNRKI